LLIAGGGDGWELCFVAPETEERIAMTNEVTSILSAIEQGDSGAADRLLP
jgi:hypothetical protein